MTAILLSDVPSTAPVLPQVLDIDSGRIQSFFKGVVLYGLLAAGMLIPFIGGVLQSILIN